MFTITYSITWKYKDRTKTFPNYDDRAFDTPEEGEKYVLTESKNYSWFDKYYYYIVDASCKVYKSNDPDEIKEDTQTMPQTMFFTFKQNNNHGTYKNMFKYVIVEADSAEEANNHKDIKWCVYFDKRAYDCHCCGPRWTPVTDEDATEFPTINNLDVTDPIESLEIDGAFFIVFKDKVVKTHTGDYINQYVSSEVKSHASTNFEKEHEKHHAQKGQGGGSGKDSKEVISQQDEDQKQQEVKEWEQDKLAKQQEEKEKLKKLSDKDLKELQKQLKEAQKGKAKEKGWYEQKWD